MWHSIYGGIEMVVLIVMGVSGSGKTTISRALAEKIGCGFADADNWHPMSNIEKMRSGIPLTDEDRLLWLEALNDLLKGWEKGTHQMSFGTGKDSSETLREVRGAVQGPKEKAKTGGHLLWRDEVRDELREKGQESKEFTKEDSLVSEERMRICHTSVEQIVSGVLACSALRQAYREILTGAKGLTCAEGYGVDSVFVVLCGSEEVIRARLEGRQGHYMHPSLLSSQLDTLEVPTENELRWRILVEDLTMSVEAIANYVLQQLTLLLAC